MCGGAGIHQKTSLSNGFYYMYAKRKRRKKTTKIDKFSACFNNLVFAAINLMLLTFNFTLYFFSLLWSYINKSIANGNWSANRRSKRTSIISYLPFVDCRWQCKAVFLSLLVTIDFTKMGYVFCIRKQFVKMFNLSILFLSKQIHPCIKIWSNRVIVM